MANNGHSEPDFFGGFTHYDDKGNIIGRSEPGLFGDYTDYDADGNEIGRSEPGLFGDYTHYDSSGNSIGTSSPQAFGGYSNSSSSDACYIATCVYGSYDCPQVWTLRRFRDGTLRANALGRGFVKLYYALSPSVVKRFGNAEPFRRFWRSVLDRTVVRLNRNGTPDTPYTDR